MVGNKFRYLSIQHKIARPFEPLKRARESNDLV